MLGIRFCLLVALSIAATSIATAEDYIVPEGVSVLTEEQLLNQIVGNTLLTIYWSQFYEPPTDNPRQGNIRGYGQTAKKYDGTWKVDGPVMCFEYNHAHTAQWNGCYTTSINGSKVNWYKLNGSREYDPGGQIKLLPGNPKNH